MKSKIKLFSPPESKSFLLKLVEGLMRIVREKDFWWCLLFLTILLLLFGTRTETKIPFYNVGDIAHSTVRAPRDIQVPDLLTTDKKRKEEQQKVLPVYDYEANLANSSVLRLHEIFLYLRNQNRGVVKNNPQKLSEEIQARWKINVPPAFLTTLSKDEELDRLEQYLTEQLRKAMSQYI